MQKTKKFYIVKRFFRDAEGVQFCRNFILFTSAQVSAFVASFYNSKVNEVGNFLTVDTITKGSRVSYMFTRHVLTGARQHSVYTESEPMTVEDRLQSFSLYIRDNSLVATLRPRATY